MKKYWIWGLDGSVMEVDDEIVCRGSKWLFHLMKQSSRQLTAASFAISRQLTADGQFSILHVFLNLMICVNNNFHKISIKVVDSQILKRLIIMNQKF